MKVAIYRTGRLGNVPIIKGEQRITIDPANVNSPKISRSSKFNPRRRFSHDGVGGGEGVFRTQRPTTCGSDGGSWPVSLIIRNISFFGAIEKRLSSTTVPFGFPDFDYNPDNDVDDDEDDDDDPDAGAFFTA